MQSHRRWQNIGSGGPVQEASIESGLYGAIAYYYVPPESETNGSIRLQANLFDRHRNLLASPFITSVTKELNRFPGQWVGVELVAEIPATINGVAVGELQLVVVLNNEPNKTNNIVFIDDVMVFKLD